VNRQIGVEDSKYVVVFNPLPIGHVIRGMRSQLFWPLTLAQDLWSLISQKPCEIDGRYKLTTYRKLHIANPMASWEMTSRDTKRSRSWPRYLWSSISRQPCEIHGPFIMATNRKPHIGNPAVTWQMTSRDPKRSKSWPHYVWNLMSQKPCKIDGRFELTTYRKHHIANTMVTWPMTSLDLKGQSRDQNTFEA